MSDTHKTRKKKRVEPLDWEELASAPNLGGMLSFLNVAPEEARRRHEAASSLPPLEERFKSPDVNLPPDDRLTPGDNMVPEDSLAPDDSLTPGGTLSSDDVLPHTTRGPGDRLAPDDSLSSGLYSFRNGSCADPRYVRPMDLAQHGHTSAEQLVYMTLWNAPTAQVQPGYRDVSVGQTQIARMAGISKRNLIRILQNLHEKFSIETLHSQVSSDHTAKIYRVWSLEQILERRRAGGYAWVYRNRTLVDIVRVL